MTELVNRLTVAAIVMGNLPEKPGFNGSVLLIDDTEAADIAKALSDAADALRAALAAPAEPRVEPAPHPSTPIAALLQQYADECSDFSGPDGYAFALKIANRYAESGPDCQMRCVVHTLLNPPEPAAQREPAIEHCLWARNGHARCPVPAPQPAGGNALAQAGQEPVMWQARVTHDGESAWRQVTATKAEPTVEARVEYLKTVKRADGRPAYEFRALVAHPPAAEPLTDEQIARHSIAASDCPPSSEVILVSSLRRLLGITDSAAGDKP